MVELEDMSKINSSSTSPFLFPMQVAEEAMAKEEPVTAENTSNGLRDVVYHIDYHGVTTHPIPKHPKP